MEKVIQLPIQEEVISVNDFYTAGIFQDESIMEGRRAMVLQGFYRIDSDYPKDRVSHWMECTPMSLSSC